MAPPHSDPLKYATAQQRELYARISSWDLTRVKSYCRNRWGYNNPDYLDKMEEAYKKYIFLICEYHDLSLPASEQFDDMWHAHIINVRDYVAFCEATFGRLLYHTPTISDDENRALLPAYKELTLPLYEKHFGEANEFWVAQSSKSACCTH